MKHKTLWFQFLALIGLVAAFILMIAVNLGYRPHLAYLLVKWQIPGADKTGHLCFMGFLAFCAHQVFHLVYFYMNRKEPPYALLEYRHRKSTWKRTQWIAAVVVLDEIVQVWIPVRTFDFLDAAMGLVGVALAHWVTVNLFNPEPALASRVGKKA